MLDQLQTDAGRLFDISMLSAAKREHIDKAMDGYWDNIAYMSEITFPCPDDETIGYILSQMPTKIKESRYTNAGDPQVEWPYTAEQVDVINLDLSGVNGATSLKSKMAKIQKILNDKLKRGKLNIARDIDSRNFIKKFPGIFVALTGAESLPEGFEIPLRESAEDNILSIRTLFNNAPIIPLTKNVSTIISIPNKSLVNAYMKVRQPPISVAIKPFSSLTQ